MTEAYAEERAWSAAEIGRSTKGKRISGGWLICCPNPAHQDKTPSCQVSDGSNGQPVFYCHGGCDWRDVKDGARARGWLPEWDPSNPRTRQRMSPEEYRQLQRAKQEAEREDRRRVDAQRQKAVALWERGQPIQGTIAETYLRARGILIPLPASLRFIGTMEHPTMVAAVTKGFYGLIDAVQLTYLKPDGSGKIDAKPSRRLYGPANTGAVHLAPHTKDLSLAEGIETGLSVIQLTGIPTWAALGSLLRNVIIPSPAKIHNVYIAADGDGAGHRAAKALALRLHGEGHKPRVVPASEGKDWNDELQAKLRAST